MKRKTDKQRLFEVMGRLDKTFKPKLNEWDERDLEFEQYPGEFEEAKQKLLNIISTSEFWDRLEWLDVDTTILPMDDHIYVFKFYQTTKSDEVQDYYDYEFAGISLGRKDNMSKYRHKTPNSVVDLIGVEELSKDFVEELEEFNREKIAEKN